MTPLNGGHVPTDTPPPAPAMPAEDAPRKTFTGINSDVANVELVVEAIDRLMEILATLKRRLAE